MHELKANQSKIHAEEASCLNELTKHRKLVNELFNNIKSITDFESKNELLITAENISTELSNLFHLFPQEPSYYNNLI